MVLKLIDKSSVMFNVYNSNYLIIGKRIKSNSCLWAKYLFSLIKILNISLKV